VLGTFRHSLPLAMQRSDNLILLHRLLVFMVQYVAVCGLNGKCGFFGDAPGLLEVAPFVDHDDAIGVHEAVGDH